MLNKALEFLWKAAVARLFIGFLCISLGFFLLIFHPHEIISRHYGIIHEYGKSFEIWSSSNAYDTYIRGYAFNITNADAFLRGKEKLKVEEVGPFVYREVMRQEELEFKHEEGIISSHPRYRLEWMPDMNTLSEDTPLMMPNVAMLFMGNKVANEVLDLLGGEYVLNTFIRQTESQPIVKQTWKEFAFGFETSFISAGYTLLPFWIHFKKTGIFDRVYDHSGDISTTYSGEKNYGQAGLIETYNGKPYLSHWEAPCNKLSGSSNGPKLGNDLLANETIYFYRKAVCRALPFEPVGESIIDWFGVSSTMYKIRDDALDNGATNPENKCFCRYGSCLPIGLSDATDCFYGFSLALSYPHFYKGDPSLLTNIDGLKPDAVSHDSYLYVNQARGALTRASIKLQINAALGDMSDILYCGNFSNMVLPLAWAEFWLPELPLNLRLGLFALTRLLPIGEIVVSCVLLLLGTLSITYNRPSFSIINSTGCMHYFTRRAAAKMKNSISSKQSRIKSVILDVST